MVVITGDHSKAFFIVLFFSGTNDLRLLRFGDMTLYIPKALAFAAGVIRSLWNLKIRISGTLALNFLTMAKSNPSTQAACQLAQERYALLGVDVNQALRTLAEIPISLH